MTSFPCDSNILYKKSSPGEEQVIPRLEITTESQKKSGRHETTQNIF